MRKAIVIVLALVAVAAAGVWGLGQFGGGLTGGVGEPQAPMIREPELVVAEAPAQPPATNPQANLRSAPAAPSARTAPATPAPTAAATPEATPAAPATVEPAQPETPPVTDPAAPAKPKLSTTLDGQGGLQLPKLPSAQPQQQAQAPAVTPAPAPEQVQPQAQARVAPAQAPEQRVLPQQAPTAAASTAAAPTNLESQFKSRQVVYNRPPKKLALDKAIDVSLVVNATGDDSKGTAALEGFQGTVVERDVDLSDTVSAQLTGIGFDITSQTVERQRLSGKTVNRWQWRVTPTETGTRTLILEIFGYATGSLDAEPLDAYRDDITVEVQQFDQVVSWAKSVQPLFAVLAGMAAVGSAAFAFLRFREEKKQTKAMGSKSE